MIEYKYSIKQIDGRIKESFSSAMQTAFAGVKTKGDEMWLMFDRELNIGEKTQLTNAVNSYVPQTTATLKEQYALLKTDSERIDFLANIAGLK